MDTMRPARISTTSSASAAASSLSWVTYTIVTPRSRWSRVSSARNVVRNSGSCRSTSRAGRGRRVWRRAHGCSRDTSRREPRCPEAAARARRARAVEGLSEAGQSGPAKDPKGHQSRWREAQCPHREAPCWRAALAAAHRAKPRTRRLGRPAPSRADSRSEAGSTRRTAPRRCPPRWFDWTTVATCCARCPRPLQRPRIPARRFVTSSTRFAAFE